jgi:hypothetical protein
VLGKHKDLLSIPFSLNVAPDSTVNKSLLFGKAPESTVNKPAHISSEVQQSQPPPLFGKARGATVNKKRAARKTTSSAPVVASGLAALKSAASGDAPTALFSAKSSASFENTNFQPPVGGQFAFPNLFNQKSSPVYFGPISSNDFESICTIIFQQQEYARCFVFVDACRSSPHRIYSTYVSETDSHDFGTGCRNAWEAEHLEKAHGRPY